MARTPKRKPRQSKVLAKAPRVSLESLMDPEEQLPWFHDPEYTEGMVVNLLRSKDDARTTEYVRYRDWILHKGLESPDDILRWRRYTVAIEDAWAESEERNEHLNAGIEDLEHDAAVLSNQNNTLEQDLETARAEIKSLQSENCALKNRVSDAEKAVVRMALSTSTKGPGAPHCFTIDTQILPTFHGERSGEAVKNFLNLLVRYFVVRCHEINWLGQADARSETPTDDSATVTSQSMAPRKDGWTRYALCQLRGDAIMWASAKFPPELPEPSWEEFCASLREEYVPVTLLNEQWRLLSISPNGDVAAFNDEFMRYRYQLDPLASMPVEQLIDIYADKLQPKISAHADAVMYRSLCRNIDRDFSLEALLAYVKDMDIARTPHKNKKYAEGFASPGRSSF
jgi:hypothetical protein